MGAKKITEVKVFIKQQNPELTVGPNWLAKKNC